MSDCSDEESEPHSQEDFFQLNEGVDLDPEYTDQELEDFLKQQAVADEEQKEKEQRLGNTDWCICKLCKPMSTIRECICCAEQNTFSDVSTQCETSSTEFGNSILNLHCVKLHRMHCVEKFTHKAEKQNLFQDANENYRLFAYRLYVHWKNDYKALGRKNRVPLPSCVVAAIRSKWPDKNGTYTGFKDIPEIDDV